MKNFSQKKMIQAVLVLITLMILSQTVFASVITGAHLNKARNNAQSNVWKDTYLNRGDRLFASQNKTTKQIIDFANNRSTRLEDIYNLLKNVYTVRYNSNRTVNTTEHENYLKAFVEINKNEFGLSQFVLETALACKLFSYTGSFKEQACQAYPMLSVALLKLILDKTPSKGLSYQNKGIYSTEVNENRGLVLVRAILPLFVARTIDDTQINGTNWSLSLENDFKQIFNQASKEINYSLQDFFAVKIVDYKLNSQTDQQAYSDMIASYDPATIVNYCFERQRIKASVEPISKIVRCTSNHVMAGFLGRLMNRVIQGVSLKNSINEFSVLIDKSIFNNNNNYVISDIYRRFEDKGIAYSFLQLRLLVTAAEIIKNKTNYDLYQIYDSKLLKSLDFMAKITSRNTSILEFKNYFNCYANNYCPEYHKYVNPNTSAKRLNWDRNYGFYIVPFKRFCEEPSYISRFPNLCESKQNNAIDSNVAPNLNPNVSFNDMKESVNFGPAQLIFMNK
jgi:hypothetical protein